MEIKNPHDKFFKETFSNKENVKDLLINCLSENISKSIDFNSITFSNKNYVDESLKETYSDLLIYARIDKSDCYIYILVEHKSYPDKDTVFQMLKYVTAIWNEEIKDKNKKYLTPVLPLVFYHGENRWKFSEKFVDYFPENNILREYIPDFKCVIYDLSDIDDKKIKGNIAFIASIMAMKHIFSDLKRHLPEILDYINKNPATDEIFVNFFRTFLYYITEASGTVDFDYIENTIKKINNEKLQEEYMTVAQQLRNEGRNEGREEGIKIGIEKGIEKGFLEGKLATARNLHKLGLDIKKIRQATDLTLEEIKKAIRE